jgi:hypothetical protein
MLLARQRHEIPQMTDIHKIRTPCRPAYAG